MSRLISHFKQSRITLLLALGLVFFTLGSVTLFAAAPNGGYTPGQTLDPDCAPGDTDCFVNPGVGGAVPTNGLQVVGGGIGLGGTLTENTVIDIDGNSFSLINGDYQLVAGDDPIGLNTPGMFMTGTTNATGTQLIGMHVDGVSGEQGLVFGNFDLMNSLINGLVIVDSSVNFVSDDGVDESNISLRPNFIGLNSNGDINLEGKTPSTNGQGEFRVGELTTMFGTLNGIEVKNTFSANSNNYSQGLYAGDVVAFNNVPALVLQQLNQTSGTSTFLRMVDTSTVGGSNNINIGVNTSGIPGNDASQMAISETAITFAFGGNTTFSIPTTTGTNGYVLTTDGGGNTSWTAGGSGPISVQNTDSLFYSGSGFLATNADYSIFLGSGAGSGATNAFNSNFLGGGAGSDATNANNSNFFGSIAGVEATNAIHSNFFGLSAGYQATNASSSNFFGTNTGGGATDANNSNFIGAGAGALAINAYHSNFLGSAAGGEAVTASNSFFVGTNAGASDTVDNTTANTFEGCHVNDCYSILLGNNTSTGGFSNSIAIGAYAENTAKNQFMIGSVERPISELVMVLNNSGDTCVIDENGVSCPNNPSSGIPLTGTTAGNPVTGPVLIQGSSDAFDINPDGTPFGNTWAIYDVSGSTASGGLAIQNDGNVFPYLWSYDGSGGLTSLMVDSNRVRTRFSDGTSCTLEGAGVSCSSDRTLKKDIHNISNGLQIITQLSGVTYHWLTDDEGSQKTPGFIAQDVESVLPEAVSFDEKTGKYSMNYTQIIPYLVEAIKTLNTAVNTGVVTGASVGELVVNKLRATEIETDRFCMDGVCINGSQFKDLLENNNLSGFDETANLDEESTDLVVEESVAPEEETPTVEEPETSEVITQETPVEETAIESETVLEEAPSESEDVTETTPETVI